VINTEAKILMDITILFSSGADVRRRPWPPHSRGF